MRVLWLLWTIIIFISTVLCVLGCVLPYWLIGMLEQEANSPLAISFGFKLQFTQSTIGLYRRCAYPVYLERDSMEGNDATFSTDTDSQLVYLRTNCGHYAFAQIPHTAWCLALVLLVSSSLLLTFTFNFVLLSGIHLTVLALPFVLRSSQAILLLAGSMVLFSCAIYPVGWSSNSEVLQICGEQSSSFRLGRCQLGWTYFTTILGGLLAIFAAILPHLWKRSARLQQIYFHQNGKALQNGELAPAHSRNMNIAGHSASCGIGALNPTTEQMRHGNHHGWFRWFFAPNLYRIVRRHPLYPSAPESIIRMQSVSTNPTHSILKSSYNELGEDQSKPNKHT
ncbi:unnamed protein product [Dicrocoelium dendriticum]|nr:unnamed protein product [Dicrocoelium dendriticum]